MMSYNRSPLAFDDVKEAFDKALESARGIKIKCKDRASAVLLRSRFNYFRKLDRGQNAKIYEMSHYLHNCSVYDKLILRIPKAGTGDENSLFIEPRHAGDFDIEEIEA